MRLPNVKSPIHFVGIGGAGMAPLAELLASSPSAIVQGSDLHSNNAINRLTDLGVTIFNNHDESNLPKHGSVVYSSAIPSTNPELIAAKTGRCEIMHRSELLNRFLRSHQGITIAGTHGKTTTSAMIVYMLDQLGIDPTAAVGGRMLAYNSSARVGGGNFFVAETDESDGSLAAYRPFLGVLTNIASDHLEVHGNLDGVKRLFDNYLTNIDPDGMAVIGWDNGLCREIGQKFSNKLTYGFVIGADVRAFELTLDKGGATFKAVVERDQVNANLKVHGRHNVENALAALGVARALELNVQHAAEALEAFPGVARRLEQIYGATDLLVYDDYAHNPGKITAAIAGLKESFPKFCLHVIYQPHRFSRLKTMFDELVSSFKQADHVYLLPTFAAGEQEIDEFSSIRVNEAIKTQSHVHSTFYENFDLASDAVLNSLEKPAMILTVGAGNVWHCGLKVREKLVGQS